MEIPYHPTSLTCSASGKVLVCGGYVVLLGSRSLVLTTSAKFHSNIQASFQSNTSSNHSTHFKIHVDSPQFGAFWDYEASMTFNPHTKIETDSNFSQHDFQLPCSFSFKQIKSNESNSKNVYVESALLYALAGISIGAQQKLSNGIYTLNIVIQADNDFYSHSKKIREQGKTPSRSNLSQLKPFCALDLKSGIAKTGLGSSAALVSSLVSSLLCWGFNWNSYQMIHSNPQIINFIHNIAQVAHCQAQGKIGSGFDVSSALSGSQQYIKFDSHHLNSIMSNYSKCHNDLETGSHSESLKTWLESISGSIHLNWFHSPPVKVCLPPGIFMTLGESGKDMNTPTSVRQVLDWAAKNKVESEQLFEQINNNNQIIIQIMAELTRMSKEYPEIYKKEFERCSTLKSSEWNSSLLQSMNEGQANLLIVNKLMDLKKHFSIQRQLMKDLGNRTHTPIEPEEISRVLDMTDSLPGVVASGAPGAGGYDAIYALTLKNGDNDNTDHLEKAWLNWEELPLSCLLSTEDGTGLTITSNNN